MRALPAIIGAAALVLIAAGCAGSGTPQSSPRPTPSHASRRPQPIAIARSSSNLFSIFPAKPGRKKCGIPEGGVHVGPLHGTCTTSVLVTHSREPRVVVIFTETWRFLCPRGADCVAAPLLHHSWQVIERKPTVAAGARLRVVATRMSGSIAPQYYK